MRNPCQPDCPNRDIGCCCKDRREFMAWRQSVYAQRMNAIAINDVMHNGITKQRKRAHLMGT